MHGFLLFHHVFFRYFLEHIGHRQGSVPDFGFGGFPDMGLQADHLIIFFHLLL